MSIVRKTGGWCTDDTGIQVMEKLLDPEDTFQDEVALPSSDELVSMMPWPG